VNSSLMRSLNACRSSKVRESDLAITGTTLTTSESFLRTTISIGFRLDVESQYRCSEHLFLGFFDIRMAGRLNEEQAAVNTSILDITFALSCELFAKVGGVLIFDVFDNWVPAVKKKNIN
jgi:hypothetical protein